MLHTKKILLKQISRHLFFTIISILPVALLSAGCSSVLYYPDHYQYIDAEKIPITPKDIYVNSSDAVQLHAWQFRAPNHQPTKAVVLLFHGNAQNLTSHFMPLYPVLNYGFDIVVFDYRGYGKSTGQPEPAGIVDDAKTIIRWTHSAYPDTPIIILAQSIGGPIAMKALIELQNEAPIRALVLDSTFSSYRSAARQTLSHHWLTWLFQPLAWLIIDNSTAPKGDLDKLGPYKKYVIHGTQDTIIDYKLGQDVYSELQEPKEFWRIDNGQHIDFMWRENGIYAKKMLSAWDELLKL